MKCPLCSQEINDNSVFCGKCGKKIPRCPSCGQVITKKAKFCVYDGTPLPDDVLQLFDQNADPITEKAAVPPTESSADETVILPEFKAFAGVQADQEDNGKMDAAGADINAFDMPEDQTVVLPDFANTQPTIDPVKETSTDSKAQGPADKVDFVKPPQPGKKPKFCIRCGKISADGQLVCPACRQKEAYQNAGYANVNNQKNTYQDRGYIQDDIGDDFDVDEDNDGRRTRARKRKPLFVFLTAFFAVLIIAALAVGAYFLLKDKLPLIFKDTEETGETAETTEDGINFVDRTADDESDTESAESESMSEQDTQMTETQETETVKESETETETESETKPEETKPEETKPEETKPAETKPEETKPEETKPAETKPAETKPAETKPAETQPPETEAPQTQAPETQPPQTQAPETQPVVDAGTGHTYEIITADLTWEQAKSECESRGGYLATITTYEEYEYIAQLAEQSGLTYIWLGGMLSSADGNWGDGSWITGESWTYDNWYPGEPSKQDVVDGTPEFYLCLWNAQYEGSDIGWTFNDQRNDLVGLFDTISGKIGYVCEYEGQ